MTTYFLIQNLNVSEDEIMGRSQTLFDHKGKWKREASLWMLNIFPLTMSDVFSVVLGWHGQWGYHPSPQSACYLPFGNSNCRSVQSGLGQQYFGLNTVLVHMFLELGWWNKSKGPLCIWFEGSPCLRKGLFPSATPAAGGWFQSPLCSSAPEAPERTGFPHTLESFTFFIFFWLLKLGRKANTWLTQLQEWQENEFRLSHLLLNWTRDHHWCSEKAAAEIQQGGLHQ